MAHIIPGIGCQGAKWATSWPHKTDIDLFQDVTATMQTVTGQSEAAATESNYTLPERNQQQ